MLDSHLLEDQKEKPLTSAEENGVLGHLHPSLRNDA